MVRLVLAVLLVLGYVAAEEDFNCQPSGSFPKTVCYTSKCAVAVKGQIQHELNAAFGYMYMGAYFAQYAVDRPGIAKFLLESATEERSHAIQMLDYLNTRGIKLNIPNYTFNNNQLNTSFVGKTRPYKAALEQALNMEIEVTNLIYNVVKECGEDYHGADVFTNPILDEQHNGVRKLQGAVKTYADLHLNQENDEAAAALAEYIFDLKMLNGQF